jgi:benzodiazapine receptor
MTKNKYFSLLILLIITSIASVIGGFTTAYFKEPWYSEIILPSFNPPSWVFAPVWTTLYIMMSLAIWRVWIIFFNKKILYIYFWHLFFNATWSIVFFGLHQIELALVNLLIIIFFVIYLTNKYQKLDIKSFFLMIPYLLWTLYAFVLNLSIVALNN